MTGGPVTPNRLTYLEFFQGLNDMGAYDKTDEQGRQGRVSPPERKVLKYIKRGKILNQRI
jgi:hypothetical protein